MAPTLPQTFQLPELALLRIKVAHLEWQHTQLQLQQLTTRRDALIRATLLTYIETEDLEHYVIDLEAGLIRLRDTPPSLEG